MRYVKGTLDYGILFPSRNEKSEINLFGYFDSAWCGDKFDMKNIARYVCWIKWPRNN